MALVLTSAGTLLTLASAFYESCLLLTWFCSIRIFVFLHIYINAYIHIYIHVYMYMYIYIYIYIHMVAYTSSMRYWLHVRSLFFMIILFMKFSVFFHYIISITCCFIVYWHIIVSYIILSYFFISLSYRIHDMLFYHILEWSDQISFQTVIMLNTRYI